MYKIHLIRNVVPLYDRNRFVFQPLRACSFDQNPLNGARENKYPLRCGECIGFAGIHTNDLFVFRIAWTGAAAARRQQRINCQEEHVRIPR